MAHDKAPMNRDQTRIVSWSADGTVRLWNVAWHGANLFEIACRHSPPDHDVSDIPDRYGVSISDPICQPGKVIPAQ